MADTTFVYRTTQILYTWLQAVNNFVYRGLSPTYGTTTGAANTYTLALGSSSLVSTLTAGMSMTWKSHQANSSAATFTVTSSVGSFGPTAIQLGGAALSGGEIASGATVTLVYDGTSWQLVSVSAGSTLSNYLLKAGGTMTGDLTLSGASIVEAEGAAVTAAATTNIWATDGNTVHVTGNTGITSFGTAPQAGAWMKVIFDGTPTLTQSANLNLNAGGSNVTIAADDFAMVYADTTTQFDVFVIRKSGNPLVSLVTSVNGSTGAVVTSVLAAQQSTTSGTTVDFTGIPSGVKWIEIMPVSVSTNGTSPYMVQIGDSGGIETAGYVGGAGDRGGEVSNSTGFQIVRNPAAASAYSGTVRLSLQRSSTFTWNQFGVMAQDSTGQPSSSSGSKSLSAELDRVRITTLSGDTFDAGAVSIAYGY